MAAAGFLSHYLSGPLPYVPRHITVKWNVLSVSLNKTFPSVLPILVSLWRHYGDNVGWAGSVHVHREGSVYCSRVNQGSDLSGRTGDVALITVLMSKVKFVLFNDATGTHWFLSYHRLLDVIHMVTLTHFLEGNPLPPHRLLFSISSKGSFICTFP